MKHLTVKEIIEILKKANRSGEETDTPEGARTITLSETLTNLITSSLENHLEEMWQGGVDRMGDDA